MKLITANVVTTLIPAYGDCCEETIITIASLGAMVYLLKEEGGNIVEYPYSFHGRG